MSIKLVGFLLLFLALAGCGFQPMYGSRAPSASSSAAATGHTATAAAPEAALDRIAIGIIPDAEGVILRNLLIDRFYRGGYPSDPAYNLSVAKVNQSRSDLDITFESEATRRLLTVTTSMTLSDSTTGAPILERSFKVVNSYDVIGSQFSTRVGEQDALRAALADIARQIELQITLFLNRGGVTTPVISAPMPIPEYRPDGTPDRSPY